MRSSEKRNTKRGYLLEHLEVEWLRAHPQQTKRTLLKGLELQRNTWAALKQGYNGYDSTFERIAKFFNCSLSEIKEGQYVESIREETIDTVLTILAGLVDYEAHLGRELTTETKNEMVALCMRALGKNPSALDVANFLGVPPAEPVAAKKTA